jgi:hypothetical protein
MTSGIGFQTLLGSPGVPQTRLAMPALQDRLDGNRRMT